MTLFSTFKKFDTANLRLRVISATVMAPLALIALWCGGLIWGGLITATVTIGLYEWLRLVDPAARARLVGIACALLAAVMIAGALFSVAFGAMLGVVATLLLFLIAVRDPADRAGWIALGLPYMGGSGLALLALREIPVNGKGLTLFLLTSIWATDIGAYVAGRLIGGPKLAPAVSPSKTWAGLLGGMVLASVTGYVIALTFSALHPATALWLAPVLAVIGQMGDLFESYFKRRAGVKESGDLIPGHGGVLDRIDGLIFAGIFMALFQAAIGNEMNWW